MRVFIDTEFFENGKTIELISIGAVREDGAAYYAEVWEARELCFRSDWLMQRVLPHLRMTAAVSRTRVEIARELREFVGEKPEFWAYFAAYDWVAVCQLYGRMIDLPSGWPMFVYDLRQWLNHKGLASVSQPDDATAHGALLDARWAAETYQRYK